MSARSYSEGGWENYTHVIRSMAVSSGAFPNAYVLSNYYTSTSGCTGQQLFRFDPINLSSTQDWIKKTLGTSACGHMGLDLGRNESFLYAYSQYNGISTLSLIDTNGNS